MEIRVYEATINGNVATMEALLEEYELILDSVLLTSFHETPLHIDIMRVAIEGHADLIEQLLGVNRSCWPVRDEAGRMMFHLAAMKWRVDVLNVMIRCCLGAVEEILYCGETSLHLCVKYNQLEALMVLVEALNERNGAFVVVPDDSGNTILHITTFLNHLEKSLDTTTEETCGAGLEERCTPIKVVATYVDPDTYFHLIVYATTSFVASLSAVLLVISGLPLKKKVLYLANDNSHGSRHDIHDAYVLIVNEFCHLASYVPKSLQS
ncbi:hypothetical protein F3Y22_tig00111678pilonHSYRG00127 [Hibiscus syriacus]|uniref:Uncharacterized protein n=1 Tax=Hibiscus syriacus TaxID=106335 RepID=A0A6A2YFG2_HIBSY|nr:hypothetical protein F3Y22_tig00111678pilonHSYRG00127 [Hibiscus syriacus]